ncbi:MAG: hypothetical protein TUN42_08350 [Dehalogenimonas sp.]
MREKLMMRRNFLVLFLTLTLLPLSACASPTVAYFPVRQDAGISLLIPLYGKIELSEGILRLREIGSGNTYALIWPRGYSYHVSGSRVEVLDENGGIVAKTGQCKSLGGSPVYSIEHYIGGKPPVPLPGFVFAVDKGSIKNLPPFECVTWQVLVVIALAILIIAPIIIWLITRRRKRV